MAEGKCEEGEGEGGEEEVGGEEEAHTLDTHLQWKDYRTTAISRLRAVFTVYEWRYQSVSDSGQWTGEYVPPLLKGSSTIKFYPILS